MHFSCLDASNGQITPASTPTSLASLVFSQLDQVNGPVYVEGALAGDTLKVEVLEVKVAEWGWTAILPGFGLLADEFSEPELKVRSGHQYIAPLSPSSSNIRVVSPILAVMNDHLAWH